ncbi:hypothetical protein [Brevibacillus choshinensis]|uniref:Uncharacterized protein n=1 Tax=Brevibacillus choshinensis TaxID=54911 RepID=A0ABX7FK38_BRECH|nr:hypothetical protein [Brevibacillus choshinensis]QRG66568.1 hypothetical protein JNE38_24105 [Brevibacillus choshinensis]
MFEAFLFSLQMYLVTLLMTPFGLVVIPKVMDILNQQASLALIVYGYLLASPLVVSSYLARLKKSAGKQDAVWSSKRKLWGRALLWTVSSHFILYEIVFVWMYRVDHQRLQPSLETVALSAVALVVIAGSTCFLVYKHARQVIQGRHASHSTVFRE